MDLRNPASSRVISFSGNSSLCQDSGGISRDSVISIILGVVQILSSVVVVHLGKKDTKTAKWIGVIPILLIGITSIVNIGRGVKEASAAVNQEFGGNETDKLRLRALVPFQVITAVLALVEACFSLLFLHRLFAVAETDSTPPRRMRILGGFAFLFFAVSGVGLLLALNCKTATWFHARTPEKPVFSGEDTYAGHTVIAFMILLAANSIVTVGDISVEGIALRKGFPQEKLARDKVGVYAQTVHVLLSIMSLFVVVVVLTSGMADYDEKLWGSIAATIALPIFQTIAETYKLARYGFSAQSLST